MDQDRRTFVGDCVNRFVKEYLGELTLFHCKGKPKRPIRIGEVVVVHDANAKRLMWTTGVVKKLFNGRDGRVRSVELKIPSGKLLTRAIQSLYPIELQEDQPDQPEAPQVAQAEPEIEAPEPAVLPLAAEQDVPATPLPTTTVEEEDESRTRDSGGEYVGKIYSRRAGARTIKLSTKAQANLEGYR
jgi:hypothetical protein